MAAAAVEPKEGQASVKTFDGDVVAPPPLPLIPRQHELQVAYWFSLAPVDLRPVGEVAEGAGDAEGCRVVLERRRVGLDRAQAGEGEMQHGRAHLLADALAMTALGQPRPGYHRAGDGEVATGHVLHADRVAPLEHDERQGPVLGAQAGP